MAKINVMIFDGKKLEQKEISNTLNSLQKIVGGYIECPYLGTKLDEAGITTTLNEEGKLINLPWSLLLMREGDIADVLCGKLIFSRTDDEGRMVSLLPSDYALIKSEIKLSNFTNRETLQRMYCLNMIY